MVREMDFVDEYYADKDLSLLKKLTLVIPTYNRNYYLSRCLWYHAHFPFGQIIVADSSPEEKKVVNRETVSKVREMFGADVLYLEYEPETEKYGGDIYRKWGDACSKAEMEYTKICTDKEFVIPEVLIDCISFLEGHDDYDTADGLSLLLHCSNMTDVSTYEAWTPYDKSYDMVDPIERVREAYSNRKNLLGNWNLLTAIRRTPFQKWIYDEMMSASLYDIRFGDFFPQLMSILCSKRKHFSDTPYLVRDLSCLYNTTGNLRKSESSCVRYPDTLSYPHELIVRKKHDLTIVVKNILTGFNIYSADKILYYTDAIVSEFLSILGIDTSSPRQKVRRIIYSSKILTTACHKIYQPIYYRYLKSIDKQTSTTLSFDSSGYGCLIPIERLVMLTLKFHINDEPIPFGLSCPYNVTSLQD